MGIDDLFDQTTSVMDRPSAPAAGAVAPVPVREPGVFGDGNGGCDDRDYAGEFIEENAAVAGTVESDEEFGDGQHWLADLTDAATIRASATTSGW